MMPPPLCNCEKSKEYLSQLHYQMLLQFLMGLNDGYGQAQSQILMKSKMLNVNQAYALINQDESKKLMVGSNSLLMRENLLFFSLHKTQA